MEQDQFTRASIRPSFLGKATADKFLFMRISKFLFHFGAHRAVKFDRDLHAVRYSLKQYIIDQSKSTA